MRKVSHATESETSSSQCRGFDTAKKEEEKGLPAKTRYDKFASESKFPFLGKEDGRFSGLFDDWAVDLRGRDNSYDAGKQVVP